MAGPDGNGEGAAGQPETGGKARADGDLDRRGRDLDARLAAHKPVPIETDGRPATGGMAGFGNAMRLSSEFIAGIVVGAGLGWFIDRMAGTSPWGLIVFLLLGFGAAVLNVLRAAGTVAEFGAANRDEDGKRK